MGVFLDVCFEDIAFLNGGVVDLDRNGVPDDPAAASSAWKAGFGALVDTLRERLGDGIPLVANPGAQDCPHEGLDGILLEGFPVGLPPDFLSLPTGFAVHNSGEAVDGSLLVAPHDAFLLTR